jgi:hypothetical protein
MTGSRGYVRARESLRVDFSFRCAYCGVREEDNGGENFEIDHFRPVSRGGELNSYANLYWSCSGCNGFKSNKWPNEDMELNGVRLLDPCREGEFPQHLIEVESGFLAGRTKAGHYHIDCLLLNRQSRVTKRKNRVELLARHAEAQALLNGLPDEIRDTDHCQYIIRELNRMRMTLNVSIIEMR